MSTSILENRLMTQDHNEFIANFLNLDKEREYLSKHQITEKNLTEILSYKTVLLQNSLNEAKANYDGLISEINRYKITNYELREQLEKLVNEFNLLASKFKKISENKKELNDNIIYLRKQSISAVNNQLAKNSEIDTKIKRLKKEFCLLVNILKFRIVNLDTVKADGVIKGYLINVDKNVIQFFQEKLDKDDDVTKALSFWKQLLIFLNSDNKENINKN